MTDIYTPEWVLFPRGSLLFLQRPQSKAGQTCLRLCFLQLSPSRIPGDVISFEKSTEIQSSHHLCYHSISQLLRVTSVQPKMV